MTVTANPEQLKPIRINLGGGRTRIPGFLTVDLDPKNDPDLVGSMENLPFLENSVEAIYASHVLEHFLGDVNDSQTRSQRCKKLIQYWFELLKPGGQLFLAVPDFSVLCELMREHPEPTAQELILDAVYGGQRNVFDCHYHGFTEVLLRSLLSDCGFEGISVFAPIAHDESQHVILGRAISLNLQGTKPIGSNKVDAQLSFSVQTLQENLKQQPDELLELKKIADSRNLLLLEQQRRMDFLDRLVADLKRDLQIQRDAYHELNSKRLRNRISRLVQKFISLKKK